MKKFILRTMFFLAIFYGCLYIFYYLAPFYWANDGFSTKMDYWKQSSTDFNAVFVGSSRTQMHIMPSLFDSITSNCNIKSFNLGYGSNSAEEIIHFTEKLLNTKQSKQLKYIFVEIRPIWYNPQNLFSARGKYILDKKEYTFLTNYYSKTKYTYAKSDYRKAFIEKILGIGMTRDIMSFYFAKDKSFLLGENKDGFINRTTAIKNDKLNKFLDEEGQDVKKTEDNLKKRTKFALESYKNLKEISDEDLLYVSRLKELKDVAQEKGIKLLYYPTIRFENTNLPAIFNAINQNEVFFNASNPEIYPELYSIKLSGDVSHLTPEGAYIYTEILADLFNEKVCL